MTSFNIWQSNLDAKSQGSQKSNINDLCVKNGKLYFIDYLIDKRITSLFCYDIENNSLKRITNDNFSIGNRVHEYGGVSYWVADNYIYFSNIIDSNIYKINLANLNITRVMNSNNRFSDGNCYQDKFVCVKEEHIKASLNNKNKEFNQKVINSIVLWNGKKIITLHNTQDFYAYPRISPDGKKILWVSWNNPNMHWDQSSLWVADIDLESGILKNIKKIISQDESVFQPEWFDNDNIAYASDRNNWWNLYLYNLNTNQDKIIIKGEFEIGEPLYSLGRKCYDFDKDRIFFIKNFNAEGSLGIKDLKSSSNSHAYDLINSKYNITTGNIARYKDTVFVIGDNSYESQSIIAINSKTKSFKKLDFNKKSNILANTDIAQAKPISFLNKENEKVHAFYYEPKNRNYNLNKKPPLIVMCHGGPIGSTMKGLNFKIQYWTNRGFAVVDVNYSGSTGYGRNYRKRLSGNWGALDVSDCYYAAKYLINNNLVDKDKIIIRGSSAGGMLVLNALAHYDIFKVGACYYPVTDLEYFEQIFNMHKYEAKYNTQLIGEYPNKKTAYKSRSPINVADKIKSPVIFFHGLDDKIVPYKQSSDMVKKLKENNIYCEYYTFEGEGHSFKKPETIEKAFEKELEFYLKKINN